MVLLWYKCHIPTPDAVSLYTSRYTISGSLDLTHSHYINIHYPCIDSKYFLT